MTETDLRPLATRGGYEPCEECGAAMDPQQRYCVECAARRGNGANPSSRYFATVNRKARRPLVGLSKKANPTSRAAAVSFFALLPIAVALGVVVGRGGSDSGSEEALIQALRKQEAANAVAAAPSASPTATAGTKPAQKSKALKKADRNGGRVVAQTKNGAVHQVTGFKASKATTEEDTKLVEENPTQTGDNYIKAQQNLPDVIVVGGSGGGSAPASNGAEP